jgi:hypothetical protein
MTACIMKSLPKIDIHTVYVWVLANPRYVPKSTGELSNHNTRQLIIALVLRGSSADSRIMMTVSCRCCELRFR